MRPKPPKTASEFADWLAQHTGHGVVLAFTQEDGSGDGAFIQFAAANSTLAEIEIVVANLLHLLQAESSGPDSHGCEDCRLRSARAADALAAIERDGLRMTAGPGQALQH